MTRGELEALPPEERDLILAQGWTEERIEVRDGKRVVHEIQHPHDGEAALRQCERLRAEDGANTAT